MDLLFSIFYGINLNGSEFGTPNWVPIHQVLQQLDDWTTPTEEVAAHKGSATVLKSDHHLEDRHVGGFERLMVNNSNNNKNSEE